MLYQIITLACRSICCNHEGHFPLRIALIFYKGLPPFTSLHRQQYCGTMNKV